MESGSGYQPLPGIPKPANAASHFQVRAGQLELPHNQLHYELGEVRSMFGWGGVLPRTWRFQWSAGIGATSITSNLDQPANWSGVRSCLRLHGDSEHRIGLRQGAAPSVSVEAGHGNCCRFCCVNRARCIHLPERSIGLRKRHGIEAG